MTCFVFSKILLRYFKFLFYLEFPYLFQYLTRLLANFNTFSRFWKPILNSIFFQCFQYHVRTLLGVCQRCLRIFRSRTSVRPGPRETLCGSIVGALSWQPPVTGGQVIVFLLISLCPCRGSHTRSPWVLDPNKDVHCQSVTTSLHSLYQWL